MRRAPHSGLCLAAAFSAAVAACSPSSGTPAAATASPGAPASAINGQLAALDLAYDTPAVVGATVRATASGLPAGKTVSVMWGTVTGGWVIEDYYHFRGKKYSETTPPLGQSPADASGRLNARFLVPEDYGGVHEVIALIDGTPATLRLTDEKRPICRVLRAIATDRRIANWTR